MKNLLIFALCILLYSKSILAQVSKVIPPEADDFYNKSMPLMRPQVKNVVLRTAKAIDNRKINADSLYRELKTNAALKGMSNNDIEGIIVLIMVQASKDADANLKKMVLEINRSNGQKKQANSETANKDKNESQDDINEIQNLKLQMIMDRKSDMAEEVNYAMKKISASQQTIINNLK
ncbi:MAG TPA: hypothetical protein VIJ92_08455 [Ginsengibacter sp.]